MSIIKSLFFCTALTAAAISSLAVTISGTVVDRASKRAIAGAHVRWGQQGEGGSVATDGNGRFAFDADRDDRPGDVIVSATGFGTRLVAVPPAHVATTLPPVALGHGATLRLHVDRGGEAAAFDVVVGAETDGDLPRWFLQRRLGEGATTMSIPDLDRGTYIVLLRGPAPLERLATRVNVGEGDRRDVPMIVVHKHLRLRLTLGGHPLANATVRIRKGNNWWESAAETNGNSEIAEPLWDDGDFDISVRSSGLKAAIARSISLRGGPIVRREIDLPNRSVRGVVVTPGGVALANVPIFLRTGSADGGAMTIRSRTAADGTFEYAGLLPGEQAIGVDAGEFISPEPVHFTFAESDTQRDLRIALPQGYPRDLLVVDRDGAAVTGALVVCTDGIAVRSKAMTDDNGRATLATMPDGDSTIFVFPAEASMAIRHFGRPESDPATGATKIVIPPASASLTVMARTVEDLALPGISLLVRWNGEIIPPAVLALLKKQSGVDVATDEEGAAHLAHIPTGVYELWPYSGETEAADLLASASPLSAPITVNVATGENRVTVRFQKRR